MTGKHFIPLATTILLFGFTSLREQQNPMVSFLKEYLQIKYADKTFDQFIYVAAKSQKLYVVSGNTITRAYTISTAKNGLGTNRGSFKTPEGLHIIAEKVGDNQPLNTIISHKIPTKDIAEINTSGTSDNRDLITSRIFHLKGVEAGFNSGEGHDSYNRGIFIHGTHEEGLLGKPASKGCVRMANKDIVELFENTEVGTFVIILNN